MLIGWETDWGRQLVRVPAVPETVPPAPVTLALLPEYRIEGGREARQQTVERPVFVPTRRPAPPPPTAPEAAKPRMQKGQFVLNGTAVVEGKSVAFLREAAGGKARSVRVGESINGLTVAEVKPDRVRLTLGDESEELLLAVAKGPRTTVQPVAPVAQGAPGTPQPGQPGGPATGGAPVAGAAPGQPGAAQPAAADAEASLLERRRAARAAQAAADAAARSGQAVPSILPAAPGAAPATPAAPDPAWAEVYRRMQQPRR